VDKAHRASSVRSEAGPARPRALLLALAPAILLALPSLAAAQDFGKGWIDRVTHELVEDEPSLSPHPVDVTFTAGELYTYDSNVYLTHTKRTRDSILTTFADANLKFADPHVDAEADLLVNYNAYLGEKDINADEERFFGRLRYQGSAVTLSLAEIFRRESSPTDAVFTTRVSRFLSNTTPLVVVKVTEVFAVELQSDLQLVNYLRHVYNVADNVTTRTLLTLAYTTDWNAVDLLVQVGYLTITYQDQFAPPDATGYVGRLGFRGEVSPNLHLVGLFGVTSMTSDDYVGTTTNVKMTTADAEVHLAYTPSDTSTLYADYSHRFGFSAEGAPFQVVDSADVILKIALRDDYNLRARIDYSRVHVPGGLRRAYYAVGLGDDWKVHPNILIDGSITYRWGVVPGSGQTGNFGDLLFTIGAAVLF